MGANASFHPRAGMGAGQQGEAFLHKSVAIEFGQRTRSIARQTGSFLAALALAGLAACASDKPETPADFGSGSIGGFAGAVAADEPRAVLVARDVLSGGGSAADAAVAAYFTMAVTLPSNAGLGGGGACLVHDAKKKSVEAIVFLPLASPDGQFGLPVNVRGMALLQARHGKRHWAELLAPAQGLALGGTAVSRALAREIATAGDKLRADPELTRIFVAPDGHLLGEGENLVQPELGTILGQIATKGAGDFYVGGVARRLTESAQAAGMPLTMETMRGALPQISDPLMVESGGRAVYFTPPPADGGLVGAELLALLSQTKSWSDASAGERPHLFVEASMRALADRSHWLQPGGAVAGAPADLLSDAHLGEVMNGYSPDRASPAASLNPPPLPAHAENPWAASLVVVDKDGNAVACNVTMNDLFGSGRMIPGTGIVLSPVPNQTGQDPFSLGPVLVTGRGNASFYFAAAASGGVTAPTAIDQVLLGSLVDKLPLDHSLVAGRLHHNGQPDVVFHEPNTDQATLQNLTNLGHSLRQADILGRVQAIWCPSGTENSKTGCQAKADLRGDGLSAVLQAQ
jgi:gamma-glutamyltranspeptidase/glutathione hydrolase